MQPAQPHLAIDYGTASTHAVLVWPGGRWEPLTFDGALALSSAVHTDGHGQVRVGEAAWRHAGADPDGFVAAPLSCLDGPDSGTVPVRGVDVPVADLVVATLRHVAAAATARAGGNITDVRMVVPAGWGPRRSTWLRQVAHRAGLGQPHLIPAPIAAAQLWLAGGMQLSVGAYLLICDVGAGCEATVLRRGPAGFEVLSTLQDPGAGAGAIDDRLLTTVGGDVTTTAGRWAAAAALRTAREALTQQAVVTVAMTPPAPAIVLPAQVVDDVAAPVLKQAGDLAARAVAAADLTADQLTGTYVIGGAAGTPAVGQAIGAAVGFAPHVVTQPGFAAVLGAADTTHGPRSGPGGNQQASAALAAAAQVPPLRRHWALVVPGAASVALFCHVLGAAEFELGNRSTYGWLRATWGELALAALLALVGCLAAASWLGAAFALAQQRRDPRTAAAGDLAVVRTTGGIILSAVAGLTVAALYAFVTAAYLSAPLSRALRWTVLPVLPVVAVVAAMAWTLRRRQHALVDVDALLAVPVSATVFTASGMVLVALWWAGPIPPMFYGRQTQMWVLGSILFGIGIACVLARRLGPRAVLGLGLALLCIVVANAHPRTLGLSGGPGLLAVLYAATVTGWATYRLWQLRRLPTTGHAY